MNTDEALDNLKDGHHVFLTGPAGSGKTTVLNKFIEWAQGEGMKVAVTASTGIAATHLGGTTIHSWCGIGIADTMSEYEIDELTQKEWLHSRLVATEILVIDEVSMLHSYRLDLVDQVLRTVRQIEEPFGGVQVVLSGDFFQLPPINRGGSGPDHFAFEAQSWGQLAPMICYLDTVYRQSDDPLLQVLNEMREGQLSEDSEELLKDRMEEELPDTMTPTRLFTHNADVDVLNDEELSKLSTAMEVFEMTSTGKRSAVQSLKKYCLAPVTLKLKVGAAVMFVKNNYQEGYVNGTLGTVVDFEYGHPIVETADGRTIAVETESWAYEQNGVQQADIRQLPLRLAWAITVHKSQGMTLDAAEIDLSKSFVPGMGYVALSRIRSLDGLYLRGINTQALAVNPVVKEKDAEFRKA